MSEFKHLQEIGYTGKRRHGRERTNILDAERVETCPVCQQPRKTASYTVHKDGETYTERIRWCSRFHGYQRKVQNIPLCPPEKTREGDMSKTDRSSKRHEAHETPPKITAEQFAGEVVETSDIDRLFKDMLKIVNISEGSKQALITIKECAKIVYLATGNAELAKMCISTSAVAGIQEMTREVGQ